MTDRLEDEERTAIEARLAALEDWNSQQEEVLFRLGQALAAIVEAASLATQRPALPTNTE